MSHRRSPLRHWTPLLLIAAGLAALSLSLVLDRNPATDMAGIQDTGTLRVLTLRGPTSYYETVDGPAGFEHELLTAFAGELDARLEIEIANTLPSVLPRLTRGDAHFAAASLNITESRKQLVRFSTPYQSIQTNVVYRLGDPRPRDFADLVGRDVVVPSDSLYAQLLSARKAEVPELTWSESRNNSVEDLVIQVWEGNAGVTFAPSNLLAVVRQHYPELRVGFSLDRVDQLAWAFPRDAHDNLLGAANRFLERMRETGELDRLLDRYYGAATKFDYVNVKAFRKRTRSILPRWEALFKEAAAEHGLDWRLLAAQSYQESYWKPGAVSPTGVRGMMQLTLDTAAFLDIEDRTDPRQSVLGGARYLRYLRGRIDPAVPEPDRTWFALAAYNIGLGHLRDARKLTRRRDKNPDRWHEVKESLLLLSDPEWHTRTRHGHARGYESVAYVTRIRSFYDILTELRPEPVSTRDLRIGLPAL